MHNTIYGSTQRFRYRDQSLVFSLGSLAFSSTVSVSVPFFPLIIIGNNKVFFWFEMPNSIVLSNSVRGTSYINRVAWCNANILGEIQYVYRQWWSVLRESFKSSRVSSHFGGCCLNIGGTCIQIHRLFPNSTCENMFPTYTGRCYRGRSCNVRGLINHVDIFSESSVGCQMIKELSWQFSRGVMSTVEQKSHHIYGPFQGSST